MNEEIGTTLVPDRTGAEELAAWAGLDLLLVLVEAGLHPRPPRLLDPLIVLAACDFPGLEVLRAGETLGGNTRSRSLSTCWSRLRPSGRSRRGAALGQE